MSPSSSSAGRFLSRLLLPLAMFVLLLSLAGNAFLLYTGKVPVKIVQSSSSSSSSVVSSAEMVLGKVAFGTVSRPVTVKPQTVDGSGAQLPNVKGYIVDPAAFPVLPPEMPIYRDQGIPLDVSFFVPFFMRLGAPIDAEKLQLLPDVFTFRSADGGLKVSFSSPTRSLVITQLASPQTIAMPTPADDIEVQALAERFAQKLALPLPTGGPAFVRDEKLPGQTPRTMVIWPLRIDGFPVLLPDGSVMPELQVQVGRVSHRAISATVNLLTPSVLISSPYPTLKKDAAIRYFMSGGLMPAPKGPKGAAVTYASARTVYLMLPSDSQYPLYLIPGIAASYPPKPDCPTCVMLWTMLPALDTAQFDWRPKETQTAAPLKTQ